MSITSVAPHCFAKSRRSGCLSIEMTFDAPFSAAIAAAVAVLVGWEWVFENGTFTAQRWLLLFIAVALGLVSLVLRAGAPRKAELMVDAAGVAILAIGIQAILSFVIGSLELFDAPSGPLLPGFWELVLLAAGCGLVAFGALERSPGPAWLGLTNLIVFVIAAGSLSENTLYWWPMLLILLGATAMAAGLRPRQPLPPEPDAYRAGEAPIASRSIDDEPVYRVRDDSPPSSTVSDR
jgi:hypothetical protein